MSWGGTGFPGSPRLRRTSRPLSMICENPDDNTGDPKVNTHTNATTPSKLCDTVNTLSNPSPTKSSNSIPTRRKAVAPLQHPVLSLLDEQPSSNYSNKKPQSPENNPTKQAKIIIPKTTSTVSSIIKRFSSPSKVNDLESDDTQDSPSSSEHITDKAKPTHAHPKTSASNASPGKFSINSNLQEVLLDKNHNNSSWKSANEYHVTSNPPKSNLDNSSTVAIDKVNQVSEEYVILKYTSKVSIPHGELRANSMTENCDENNRSLNDIRPSSSCSRSGVENPQHFTEQRALNVEGSKNHLSNDNDTDCHRHPSDMNDILNNDNTSEDANPSQTTHDKICISSTLKEYNNQITVSSEIPTTVNHTDNSVVHYQSPINDEVNHFEFDSKSKTSNNKTVIFQNDQIPPHSTSSSENMNNISSQFKDVQHSNVAFSISTQSRPSLTRQASGSDVTLDTNLQDQDKNSPSLDGETLEWKKRVKRSISLIKVPNSSEITGAKRRISSIHLSKSNSNTAHRSEYRLNPNPGSGGNSDDDIYNNNQSVFKNRVTDQSNCSEPVRRISSIDQSEFSLLKATATRLNLATRRPSVTAWKEKYLNLSTPFKFLSSAKSKDRSNAKFVTTKMSDVKGDIDPKDGWAITDDVKNRINGKLAWLRRELIDIRLLDQSLARQFLNLRHAMNAFRLAVECEDHQELIKDAEEDMEEIRELSQLVDIPPEILSHLTPLKHVGVTRMNISERRFSTC